MSQFNIKIQTNSIEPDPIDPIDPTNPVDPVDPEPIDPVNPEPIAPVNPSDSTISAPNTGGNTNNSSSSLNPILPCGVILFALSLIATILYIRFRHNHKIFSSNKSFSLNSRKNLLLAIIPIILLIPFICSLLINQSQNDNNAIAASGESLAISTEDIELNISREQNESAYGLAENKITVNSATNHGYVLSAYASSTDIVSSTDSSNKITSVQSNLQALESNTWGLALTSPQTQTEEIFSPVSTSQNDPLIIKNVSTATTANDTTTVYYGAYVGPDLPDGTYSGVTINYFATANVVPSTTFTLSFNANDGTGAPASQTCTTETTSCSITTSATQPTRDGYTFLGWADSASATAASYQPSDILSLNQDRTIYAVWQENVSKVYFLSTGNSNSFLLESNGHYGLIDASNGDRVETYNVQRVVTALDALGVEKLDFVIATHSHYDHIGGMPTIAAKYVNSNTKYYYRTYIETAESTASTQQLVHGLAVTSMSLAGAQLIEVTNQEPSFYLGNFAIQIMNSEPAADSELDANGKAVDENKNSLVVLATHGNKKVLFAGDMEYNDETKIANKVGKVDILQMGHHGYASSTSVSFLNALGPKDVVIPRYDLDTRLRYPTIVYASYYNNTNFYITGAQQNAIIATFKGVNNYELGTYNNNLNDLKLDITYPEGGDPSEGTWAKITCGNTVWVHFDTNNKLDTGWKQLTWNGTKSWYYFDTYAANSSGGGSGGMYTGTHTINGQSYTFDAGGACISGEGCPLN